MQYLVNYWNTVFNKQYIKQDMLAGINVAMLAIPLALAISLASGVSPSMALTSAVVGGIVAALFGDVGLGISGAALTMTVLISHCVANHGVGGLFVICFIAGLLQLLFGVFRLGRFTRLIPMPVVYAFISAIGVVLLFSIIPTALQGHVPELSSTMMSLIDIGKYADQISIVSIALFLLTIVIIKLLPKYYPRFPIYVFAIVIPSVLVYVLGLTEVSIVGDLTHKLTLPHIPRFMAVENWHSILISAISVFAVITLESTLSARATDIFASNQKYHPNQELIGQGMANIIVALFGGVPVSELIVRTKTNLDSGAKTRQSAIFHSIFILLICLVPNSLKFIPWPVLGAIIMWAALPLINIDYAREYWNKDKSGFAVYLITLVVFIFTDITQGIQIGVMVALVIMVVNMLTTKVSVRLWDNQQVLRLSVSGNLTILSIDTLDSFKSQIMEYKKLRFIIFAFNKIQSMDNAGVQELIYLISEIRRLHIKVIIHGLTREQYQMLKLLNTQGVKFYNTVSESEIKDILESDGIEHSANEVLKQGLEKFHEQYASQHTKLIETLAKEQKPHTLLITCSDSRLNPNEFFSVNLGEIFVIRNVGNVIPPFRPDNKYSEVAAIEYAIAALDIRNIVICAHTECGAVKASMANHSHGSEFYGLDNWLQIIKDGFAINIPNDSTHGTKINALYQAENLKTYPMVQKLLASNQLTISAWVYDVHSAHMLEWDDNVQDFTQIVKI